MRFWASCALGVATVAGAAAMQTAVAATLVEMARSNGQLGMLLKAAESTGLAEELQSEKGPLTLLAPSDAAFAALGDEKLKDLMRPENADALARLLKRHIVAQAVSYDLIKGQTLTVPTLDGTSVTFDATGTALKIDGHVAASDSKADNGVIVVVDKLLAAS